MKYIIDPYPKELKALNTKIGFYKKFAELHGKYSSTKTPREVFESLNKIVYQYFGREHTTNYRSFSIQYKTWKLKHTKQTYFYTSKN
jgi:hypothetical protein